MFVSMGRRDNPERAVQVKDAFGDKKGMKGLVLTDTESGADYSTAALRGARPAAHATSNFDDDIFHADHTSAG